MLWVLSLNIFDIWHYCAFQFLKLCLRVSCIISLDTVIISLDLFSLVPTKCLITNFAFGVNKQKREAPQGEKPEPVRTHLRNMIIVPEMIGSIIGVYNGKTFNQVEIKPEMIGHYLAEFSISYKPVKHGRPGVGATHSSRFIPLKWRAFTCGMCWIVCFVFFS